jgi:hypothetical protein
MALVARVDRIAILRVPCVGPEILVVALRALAVATEQTDLPGEGRG